MKGRAAVDLWGRLANPVQRRLSKATVDARTLERELNRSGLEIRPRPGWSDGA